MAIYEVHAGSWRRNPIEGFRSLTWRELAAELVPYVVQMGFTHIELLPVMEHPFDRIVGLSGHRFLRADEPLRQRPTTSARSSMPATRQGIGVILDWVPGHFPKDDFALARFDGTALYEHADPRQGEHRDWGTLVFNFGRHEVRNFLLTNALYWLESFHVDGLRVDAVASMLYLDYSRDDRRVGAEQIRRPREPGGHRLPPRTEHDNARPVPGHRDDRGGIDRVSRP